MNRFLAIPGFIFCFMLTACLGSQNPAPVAHYGTGKGAGSAGMHSVLPGDTLWQVSKRYNLPMRDIALTNKLRAPFILHTGQRLKLPPPREYRVRSGDTLYSISRLFGVNTSELARLNDLGPPYTIQAGQNLRLPSLTRKTRPEAAPKPKRAAAVVQPSEKPRISGEKPSVKKASAARPQIPSGTPARSSGKFLMPVRGPVIASYGPKEGGLHNDGINIRAPKGAPVRAAENGVVVYAGDELEGSGNLILIRHEDRWMSAYAHLGRILIKRGDTVRRGQTIGTVGQTGSVDSPQLHFEIRRGTEAINPARYLES